LVKKKRKDPPRRAPVGYRGSLYRAVKLAPSLARSETMLSPALSSCRITEQHIGMRCVFGPGYPPIARWRSPAFTSRNPLPASSAALNRARSSDRKSSAFGGMTSNRRFSGIVSHYGSETEASPALPRRSGRAGILGN
jgi:hypothetical protein